MQSTLGVPRPSFNTVKKEKEETSQEHGKPGLDRLTFRGGGGGGGFASSTW